MKSIYFCQISKPFVEKHVGNLGCVANITGVFFLGCFAYECVYLWVCLFMSVFVYEYVCLFMSVFVYLLFVLDCDTNDIRVVCVCCLWVLFFYVLFVNECLFMFFFVLFSYVLFLCVYVCGCLLFVFDCYTNVHPCCLCELLMCHPHVLSVRHFCGGCAKRTQWPTGPFCLNLLVKSFTTPSHFR